MLWEKEASEANVGTVERRGIDQETAQNHEKKGKEKDVRKNRAHWLHSIIKEKAKVVRRDMAVMAHHQAKVRAKGSKASVGTAIRWATLQPSAEAKAKARVPKAEKERTMLEQRQAENGLHGTTTAQHGETKMPERSEM